jgi:SPP1 family predicted phage head-tail adaptor
VYRLNRRVTINRYTTSKNEFGGLVAVLTGSWSKWAEAQDRTGSTNNDYQQSQWTYDHVFIMRHERERPLRSNDVIEYDSQFYRITEIQLRTEGHKKWERVLATKLDESINSDAPMDTGNIKVFNYTAIGGEFQFTENSLIGKSVFNVFKDGIQMVIITVPGPVDKEVYYNSGTGEFTFTTFFEPNEIATIIYY